MLLHDVQEKLIAGVFHLMNIFPIQKNKIVILNFLGNGYGDNGKYIAKELLSQTNDYDVVWLTKKTGQSFLDGIREVAYGSLRAIYEQCTAKVWIDNRRKPGYVRKRKGQYYINTWHGNTALKKVEKDATGVLPYYYVNAAKRDSKMVDVFLSSGKWDTSIYKNSFWYDGEIVECGYPRQDILFQNSNEQKIEIKRRLGIDLEEQILLYVPTFRSGERAADLSVYNLDYLKVIKALEERLGGKWRGMVRLHPNVAALGEKLNIPEEVINVTNYPDMQELMLIADCAISDYSSSLIEAGAAGKYGFVFATDFDVYMRERDAYFALEDLPFPVAKSNDELVSKIQSFDIDKYVKDCKCYYDDICGINREGNASKIVVEMIKKATK